MAKTKAVAAKEEPLLTKGEPTNTQIYKMLLNFIDETRGNFSSVSEDRDHDYEQLQLCNRNVVALEGKVENLVMAVSKMSAGHKRESQNVTKIVENSVEDLKETVANKKVIIKEIPHFSMRLFIKSFFRKF